MVLTGSSFEESITASAPKSLASFRRSAEVSTAITRAPIAAPSTVAERPTGPWPNTASVSPPAMRMRRSAPYAVPVPQATAAPSAKDSSSGKGTRVRTGTFR